MDDWRGHFVIGIPREPNWCGGNSSSDFDEIQKN
jgi:hypothetical protein